MARSSKISVSSTAEYFAKNLQQVGFSSPTKAVLTTLKEAVDNALDACEDHGILPHLIIKIEKVGSGSLKNTDRLRIYVEDNGPGIDAEDIPKVFGEYLASSKFGKGRCTRGQQGIGISAATTWAMQTTATGAKVKVKKKGQKKAIACDVTIDLKNNKGVQKDKKNVDWDKESGTAVEFLIDGRIQLNGEAGLYSYFKANTIVNPHMSLHYELPGEKPVIIERVSNECPFIPEAIAPHPHTMKLGDFLGHAKLFGKIAVGKWLTTSFSRITAKTLDDIRVAGKYKKNFFDTPLSSLDTAAFKALFEAIQNTELKPPPTSSVLSIGEEGLSKSIQRLGDVDFFAVMSRKPTICDYKPVQIEVAIARLLNQGSESQDEPIHLLRFANRVPLQFDRAACAVAKAVSTVNWRSYGLKQPKNGLPTGPYVVSVSVVSPFIKFKNASKETIDGSDDLIEEIRKGLMQAGQKLAKYVNRENKEKELEQKLLHIQKFGPILVETLARITNADDKRKKSAEDGLMKILGKDTKIAQSMLEEAEEKVVIQNEKVEQILKSDH